MILVQEGLSGFKIEKKAGEYIEGYFDKTLLEVSADPLEEGGDPTADPWIS